MSIRISHTAQKEVVISLDETFDFNNIEEFRRAYEQLELQNQSVLTVDFSLARYIDSSALGMLIKLQQHVEKKSCRVRLINLTPDIRKIFSISRFDQKFEIR